MRKRAPVFDELAALNYTWCQNAEMDDMAWRLRKPGSMANIGKGRGKKKVGRNDPLPMWKWPEIQGMLSEIDCGRSCPTIVKFEPREERTSFATRS
jgi:hypothetical protein